jgi:hypothetical protein
VAGGRSCVATKGQQMTKVGPHPGAPGSLEKPGNMRISLGEKA